MDSTRQQIPRDQGHAHGLVNDPREARTHNLRGHGLEPGPQFTQEDPERAKNSENWDGREGKKKKLPQAHPTPPSVLGPFPKITFFSLPGLWPRFEDMRALPGEPLGHLFQANGTLMLGQLLARPKSVGPSRNPSGEILGPVSTLWALPTSKSPLQPPPLLLEQKGKKWAKPK